jgi:hypothetical protein
VLLELIKPDFLRGSPMIVTVKIFDMVVPEGIYNRFMKKKYLDYKVQVGNPGPFLFLNAFKRFVYVKTLTLAIDKLEL